MNIFALDDNPEKAARMLCDRHVPKMVVESAQILSTALLTNARVWDDGAELPVNVYRPTHLRHPAVLWAAASPDNFDWLGAYAAYLCGEFSFRFGGTHKTEQVIKDILAVGPAFSHPSRHTPFAQCMPEMYQNDDPVMAYRDYYAGAKAYLASWDKGRSRPDWWERHRSRMRKLGTLMGEKNR